MLPRGGSVLDVDWEWLGLRNGSCPEAEPILQLLDAVSSTELTPSAESMTCQLEAYDRLTVAPLQPSWFVALLLNARVAPVKGADAPGATSVVTGIVAPVRV